MSRNPPPRAPAYEGPTSRRRRSLVHEADFRKLAKVAREENVIVRGRVAASGLDFTIEPARAPAESAADDFADRIDAFGAM